MGKALLTAVGLGMMRPANPEGKFPLCAAEIRDYSGKPALYYFCFTLKHTMSTAVGNVGGDLVLGK